MYTYTRKETQRYVSDTYGTHVVKVVQYQFSIWGGWNNRPPKGMGNYVQRARGAGGGCALSYSTTRVRATEQAETHHII